MKPNTNPTPTTGHTAGPYIVLSKNGPFSMEPFKTAKEAKEYADAFSDDLTVVRARVAAAAPELLDACGAAEIILSAIECGQDKPLAAGMVLDQLRSALNKATGK